MLSFLLEFSDKQMQTDAKKKMKLEKCGKIVVFKNS